MNSYDYAHREGVVALTWDDVAALARQLAAELAAAGVDSVVGIARAGLLPAVIVAAALRCDLWPVRVTRREQDNVAYTTPQWKVDVSPEVAGRTVAVIDEMADTGETLALVAARVQACGAAQVITASLCAHTWAEPRPAHVALTTDALVVFPWDSQVLVNGSWAPHPELEEAIRAQEQQKSKP